MKKTITRTTQIDGEQKEVEITFTFEKYIMGDNVHRQIYILHIIYNNVMIQVNNEIEYDRIETLCYESLD